jgi:hypothetical protein
MAGCGLAGNPQPPTLWLPEPVKDLAAARAGDEVHLRWTMPKDTTDKVTLKGDQRAHFCWVFAAASGQAATAARQGSTGGDAGGNSQPAGRRASVAPSAAGFDAKACRGVGDGMFAPGRGADFTAKMPAELTLGGARAAAFYVELQNHAGKTAGESNAAWVLAGAAPAGVTGLRLETRAEGVVLRWDPAEAQAGMVVRIHRELVARAGAGGAGESKRPGESKASALGGAGPAEVQVLEVDLSGGDPDKRDPGVALDRDAALDHEWTYWVERVVKVEVGGRALEVAGPASEKVSLFAKDVFPPAVPAGLTVVVDSEARAMDLSWTPDADADLAGYVVYRRDVTAGGSWERISAKTVVPPSYSDAGVVAGHKYAYAVSAVDADGNESEKSGEVVEGLPE